MKRYFILYDVYQYDNRHSGCFTEVISESVKDCMSKYLDYLGEAKEVVLKGLSGFDETDVEGLINYTNMFISGDNTIKQILEVDNNIWELAGADKR